MSSTHQQISELSLEQKRALLAQLLKEKSAKPKSYALSFAQQRMWVVDQLEPNRAAYNMPAAVRLRGQLNVTALKQTLNEIMRRHESLRTTFPTVNGQPIQLVNPPRPLSLSIVDLGELPEDEREAEAKRLAGEEARRPFDLADGPLLRVALVRLNEEDHVLLWMMHHIICDGITMLVLIHELGTLYLAFSQGQPSPLPEPSLQYADFAVWQRESLQGGVLDEQLAYWKQHLGGPLPVLSLPTDRPRPPVQSLQGVTLYQKLPLTLYDALKTHSRQENAPLFMTLLAAFKILLYRLTGQEDLIVGTPISGRSRVETEEIVGLFLNTLALRTNLSGDPTSRELLERVREVAVGAYAHQDLPFEMLVEELQPERSLSYSPIFQAMFQLTVSPKENVTLPGLTISPLVADSGTAKFDITLMMIEAEDLFGVALQYSTDLFDEATMARMLGMFQRLLEGIVADPDQHISTLPLLSETERAQLITEWNQTATAYPREHCLHQLFQEQAARTPDQIALKFGDEQLTYRQLNERANQLAHHLRTLGVGAEALVVILMERSAEMLISLLGVLKAGGAYVPLDPAYPQERLNWMLEDSGARVVLTQESLRERFGTASTETVCLDSEWQVIARQSVQNPESDAVAENLAYVIYTSGSTGKPKGVQLTHRCVSNFLSSMQLCPGLCADDVLLAVTTLSFDIAGLELYLPLITGARILLASREMAINPLALKRELESGQVSVMQATPATWRMLIESGWNSDRHALSNDGDGSLDETSSGMNLKVLCGGEALGSELATQLLERAPEVWNLYGPTETTIWSSLLSVTAQAAKRAALVSIGRPINNTQLYVLDEKFEPVPIGVAGELYIGGEGVARGYLNRAELTAERFIPDRFNTRAGARLYRTGDVARYISTGEVEYLGRSDQQVKVRGYRIEVGEIEAVMSEHAWIREAVVVAREDTPGDKRLVAYVVAQEESELSVSELRPLLSGKLPEYMIPSSFVVLEQLPLTPNGKVDRRALPAPEQSRAELEVEYVGPRTEVEEIVAGIWAEVLGVERVGVHDNFFQLGGHSLLATQAISRMRGTFDAELTLRHLFEQPTVASLAESVEVEMRAGRGLHVPPIVKVSRDGELPLSFAQQRQWILDQFDPGSADYNIPAAVRLQGQLNVTALEQTLDEIINRHEALRTTFAVVNGNPVQVINPAQPAELSVVDLSESPAPERETKARQLIGEEAHKPFDLERGPLVRVQLLRLGEEDHVLLWTMHHIVGDNWSLGVLIQELAALYGAFSDGRPSPLPELPIQYADFAYWQRQWLQGEVLDAHLSYWKQQLDHVPALQLPTDRPRPPVQTFSGANEEFRFSSALTGDLKTLSRRVGGTLFMLLLAAFKTLLSRYTAQENFSVGTFIANRNRSEIEGLVGFFVNNLALRADLSGNPPFKELLRRVREVTLGAYAHQDLPFEKVLEELQPERDMSRTPLFQVMFVLQNAPGQSVQIPGLTLTPLGAESVRSNFDLTVWMSESNGTLAGTLQYNTDLFDAATIRRMASQFETLLQDIVANPQRRLSELALLSDEERHQLTVEWNQTHAQYPHHLCIHQLFEAQVLETPHAIAVSDDEHTLTYAELNRRANQLAHFLQSSGVGPEHCVGICLERSVRIVVCMLAVLKAGGAYLPLDPAYPAQRLSFMMEDAGVRVVLTAGELVEAIDWQAVKVLQLESEWEEIATESEENPSSGVEAENLAYVIYTSGSTGLPKGVQVHHSALGNLVAWHQHTYSIRPEDRASQVAAQSFDASVWELWPYLSAGASVHLPDMETIASAEKILGWLASQTITHCFLPTPLAAAVIEHEQPEGLALKYLLTGGDQLQKRAEQELSYRLVNHYGPTECTVVATSSEVSSGAGNGLPPIGRPINNTQLYVLDEKLEVVPIGVAGELYIGGEGVARGYLNRAELTAERFIPDRFNTRAGARLYRTGDVARYISTGEVEYLGRSDQQVKVRGYRIEVGEIEAVLCEHEGVREAVVVAREESPSEKRLVAYVVSATEQTINISKVRAHLRERVPDYMMPSLFVELEQLPLTSSGKVDRRALPAPEHGRREMEEEYVAPRTPIEQALCEVWSEILKVEGIGINDNFFELSGHSLQATQMLSRVRRNFEVEIALRVLFEEPTIASLAGRIEAALRSGEGLQTSFIAPMVRDKELPLSFAQQRLWFLDQLVPGNTFYNIPTAVRLTGQLNIPALEQAFTEIIRRHESLRTTFITLDGRPVQLISAAAPVSLPVVDLRQVPETERQTAAERLFMEDAGHHFDLARGPLLRVRVLRLGEEDYVLLTTMHHIITDDWSLGVLVRELAALYEAFSTGQESPLEELSLQYADYAHWQREWLQGEVLDAHLSYWKQQLAGAPPVLELPTDRRRPAVQTFRGATQTRPLSETLSNNLRALGQREGATLFMTLLAAFQTLLSRYTGAEDIVVGSPIAGRNRAEVEHLIGFFVNTLALRTDVDGDLTFRQLLARTRETALGAFAHQDVPFEMLVEELRPVRSLSYSPLFQVMFVLQNVPREVVELPGLKMNALIAEGGTAKFDLTLSVMEREQGLVGALQYNTDLFDDATITRMLGHFEQLLTGIVGEGGERLSELPLLTEVERLELLAALNDVEADAPTDLCIHRLFEAQVRETPSATALIFEERRMTYDELNRRSNQLARKLQAMGVGPETRVGLCLARSPEMIVGLLAILKAGAAYVPLDPAYPTARLTYMLEDAQVAALLTERQLAAELPQSAPQVVCLDTDWAHFAGESEDDLETRVKADNLAYIIYTSGSTGQPKGVMIEHRSLVNYIETACADFGLTSKDRVLQFASLSFDAAAEEIYPCLTRGGALVLRTDAMLNSAQAFIRSCLELELTVLDLPTAYWHHLTAELANTDFDLPDSIRLVIIGGERALPERLANWHETVGREVRLINTYGPTEATIVATKYELSAAVEATAAWREVPIGRAVRNVQAYLLDRSLQPVPSGVPGELYLAGHGLARGYFGRPEQTAERFVAHPFSDAPGARLYRTGDLARRLSDGIIEFVGRSDHQVKVRGFRIELGEVEAVLCQHKGVREAVVMAREDVPGEKRLVAYLTAGTDEPLMVGEVRRFVADKVPDYMVPSLFVMLEELPLTLSGKVDRRALPAPDQGRPELGQAFIAPRTPTEERLALFWAEVLRVERVGINDNFFEMGGHSLLATQLVLRVRDAFNVELPLRKLFEWPTVAGLSVEIEKLIESGARPSMPAITPLSRAAHRMKRSSLAVPRKT